MAATVWCGLDLERRDELRETYSFRKNKGTQPMRLPRNYQSTPHALKQHDHTTIVHDPTPNT